MRRKIFVVDAGIQSAIDDLRERYELPTEADAIRLALVILSASPTLKLPPDFVPTRKAGRRPQRR